MRFARSILMMVLGAGAFLVSGCATLPRSVFMPLPDLAGRAGLKPFVFPRDVFAPGSIVRVNQNGDVVGPPLGSLRECFPEGSTLTPSRGGGLSGDLLNAAERGLSVNTDRLPLRANVRGRAIAVLRLAGSYSSTQSQISIGNLVASRWGVMSSTCRDTLQAPDSRILTEVYYAAKDTTVRFVQANGQELKLSEQDLQDIANAGFGALNVHVEAGHLKFDSDLPLMYALYRPSLPQASCSFAVELLRDPRYVACVKALPQAERAKIMVEAAVALRASFETTSRLPQSSFSASDFASPSAIVDFLRSLDADNGHALYYEGTIRRWIYKDNRIGTDFLRSNESFLRYLQVEETLTPAEKDGNANTCYARAHGYCAERTAWIAHQLANDLYTLGVLESRDDKKRGYFKDSLEHAARALETLDGGFNQPGQGVPTQTLVQCLRDLLAGPSLVTPTSICPPPVGSR